MVNTYAGLYHRTLYVLVHGFQMTSAAACQDYTATCGSRSVKHNDGGGRRRALTSSRTEIIGC
jgi:hypothetical protein